MYTCLMVTAQVFAAKAISENLQNTGHAVGTQDVIPATAETPVERSQELEDAGAEFIGEDLTHMVEQGLGDLTTGGSSSRVTKSSRFLGTLLGKLRRKKQPSEEIVIK